MERKARCADSALERAVFCNAGELCPAKQHDGWIIPFGRAPGNRFTWRRRGRGVGDAFGPYGGVGIIVEPGEEGVVQFLVGVHPLGVCQGCGAQDL